MLSGQSRECVDLVVGLTIKSVTIDSDNDVVIELDGARLRLSDTGQDCCEYRYTTTDEDLAYYQGAKLLGVEVMEGPESPYGGNDVHEQCFLWVRTSVGVIDFVTHNEHNGYYGGFSIAAVVD